MSAFIRDHIFMIWMTKNNIWAQVLCGADSAPTRLLDWADEYSWFSYDFFFLETQNFQKNYIKPPKFLILVCFKHQKRKLHCFLTLITSLSSKWQAIKWAWGGIRPITAWLGLKYKKEILNFWMGSIPWIHCVWSNAYLGMQGKDNALSA